MGRILQSGEEYYNHGKNITILGRILQSWEEYHNLGKNITIMEKILQSWKEYCNPGKITKIRCKLSRNDLTIMERSINHRKIKKIIERSNNHRKIKQSWKDQTIVERVYLSSVMDR